MSAYVRAFRGDPGDWLRLVGGLLFAVGALVLFVRKEESWSDVPLLVVLLVPCAALYGMGVGAGRGAEAGGPDRVVPTWQGVFLVFGVLLVPLVLFQFLEVVDGDTGNSLNSAWIFLATAALAGLAARRRGATYAALLAGLSFLTAWLFFWEEILDDPSIEDFRWLLILVGAGLLAVALALRGARPAQSSELVTAAGLAAVGAGLLVSVEIAVQGFFGLFGGDGGDTGEQGTGWDAFLLVVSLALVIYGSRAARRGPAYVGAIGLAAFVLIIGRELAGLAAGDDPEGKVMGWPLLLLVVGGAALVASFVVARRGAGRPVEAPVADAGVESAAPPPAVGEGRFPAPGEPASSAGGGLPEAPGGGRLPEAPGRPPAGDEPQRPHP